MDIRETWNWLTRLGDCFWQKASAAGNGWNDAHLIACAESRGFVFQKANIFTVYIKIEEPAELAILITKPGTNTRESGFHGINQLRHTVRFQAHTGLISSVFLQGSGNQNLNSHVGWAQLVEEEGVRTAWAWSQAVRKLASWGSMVKGSPMEEAMASVVFSPLPVM